MVDVSSRPTILAVQGADREVIQSLLAEAARRLRAGGVHVLGVVEDMVPGIAHHEVMLLDLASGATHRLHQDLGPGSSGCALDPEGLAAACAGVENAIAARLAQGGAGADTVVILSKFGRQEAEGRGLTSAFHAAVAAEFSVLTSVSPSVAGEWVNFAGDMARVVSAELDEVEAWWHAVPAVAPL
ncbi:MULTISPECIES: DUF2478 domain-containing protein [unclassified Xanthobacter]|uniref:DUF2478 domain-containing protein n=1 Tax=unclassified Xanthobacter TaxID=2623496 RepID=UPI001F4857AA|nr:MULTISPECIES: DUF2478 domain-containing protein [unclassified Xanthobacter]